MSPSAESYELTFEGRPQYLFAHIKCDSISSEIALNYLREIVDKSVELGQTRILIDREIPEILSDSSLFFTTNEFVKMSGEGTRVAFVNRFQDNSDYMEFAMVISRNRGAKFDLFNNITDAEAWLLEA